MILCYMMIYEKIPCFMDIHTPKLLLYPVRIETSVTSRSCCDSTLPAGYVIHGKNK